MKIQLVTTNLVTLFIFDLRETQRFFLVYLCVYIYFYKLSGVHISMSNM